MINVFTVTFFGHREVQDVCRVEQHLEDIIENVLKTHEYVEFLVGKNGEFDIIAASCVRRVTRRLGLYNSELVLVLPYETAEFANNQEYFLDYYDRAEIFEQSSRVHYKKAIIVRNQTMIERAQLVICFVLHEYGGSWCAMRYAQRKNRKIIRINA